MTTAEQAYNHWKKAMKMDLRVYTDQQLFELGFNAAKSIMNEMEKLVSEMERENKKLSAEIKKLRKANKNESA